MKRMLAIVCLLAAVIAAGWAQQLYVVSGSVSDQHGRQPLPHASVSAGGVSTVTNEQGRFTLKLSARPAAVVASMLGYKTQALTPTDGRQLSFRLQPASIQLSEVLVRASTAEELVRAALAKVPQNYSSAAMLYKGFYRETVQKRSHFIAISEAVVDLYKTSYQQASTSRDRVAITRGRRLLNMKPADTLGVKIMGGPMLPVIADVVKNDQLLFYADDMPCYEYSLEAPQLMGDRLQYVVTMRPRHERPYALFHATLYIDQQSLALTRAELQLDMSNRQHATSAMLHHKPLTLRFRPRELTFVIDYRTEQGVTHLSYVRNTIRFNCDWRRRLFSSPFTVTSEFVVTHRQPAAAPPPRGSDTFSRRDKLYDRVEYFSDPHFWGPDNIIEPTETLDKAVDRLKRRVAEAKQ